MSNTSLLGSYGGLGNSGLQFRNKIINGDMRIYQRGSLATPITNTGSTYVLDRFWVNPSGGSITISQESTANEVGLPSEFSYYQKLVVNTGDNYAGVVHRIEDARTLAGQTVTFSFWAKGTNPGGGQFRVRLFVEHDSATTDVSYEKFMVITSSWKKYSFTFNLAEIVPGAIIGNNSCLQAIIEQNETDTSTAAWALDTTGWQLEAGPVATPFEHRPYGLELSLCQRYYERITADYAGAPLGIGGFMNTTTAAIINSAIAVPKRARASLETTGVASDYTLRYANNLFQIASSVPTSPTTTGPVIGMSINSSVSITAGTFVFLRAASAGVWIAFNAEL